MSHPSDELYRLTATVAVARLKRREITPLDLIDAAARRIAAVEPAINALPTLYLERARVHAERLMRGDLYTRGSRRCCGHAAASISFESGFQRYGRQR